MQLDKQTSILVGVIAVLILAISFLATLVFDLTPDRDQTQRPDDSSPATDTVTFELPDGPELNDTPLVDAPSYFFLFTHTEDQFNHELSEERYWRVGEMVREADELYPDANITWTVEFMGADMKTIADRNSETGLVDYLLELKDEGLVEYGYHAHHDPTYSNRPQTELSNTPTYEETYDALFSWITCEKDPIVGGCVEERGGGLEAIYNTLGQVEIVTGLGIGQGVQIERSAGSQAVRELLPDRYLGFGFPNHGAVTRDQDYQAHLKAIAEVLTPTHETSSATFWMDNTIRINDDATLEDINPGPLREGAAGYEEVVAQLDGTRPIVINAGIASKYLYTASSTSPTKWGYDNPTSPELPDRYLLSPSEREKMYNLSNEALLYMAEAADASDGTLQFASSTDVVNLFTSEDYWSVSEEELYQMALWVLNNWDEVPPNWTYDGEDFYSLVDTFALLARGLQGAFDQTDIVSEIYGPWSLTESRSNATTVSAEEVRALAKDSLYDDGRMRETYTVGDTELTSAQVLYAWSFLLVADQLEQEVSSIEIPATDSAPETYELLESLGCTDCLDTAWSLKPARFQD